MALFPSRCTAVRYGSRCAIRKLAGSGDDLELTMVTILYAIFIADLGILKWGSSVPPSRSAETRVVAIVLDDLAMGSFHGNRKPHLACIGN